MSKTYLITGGAGFIGSNYAAKLLERGDTVTIFDNLVRSGTERNIEWLQETYGAHSFEWIREDVRNAEAVDTAVKTADVVVHLAGQVAVTSSVLDPMYDFSVNAGGTLTVLEAVRKAGHQPIVIYSSTNKVYGGMENMALIEEDHAYRYRDFPFGIAEDQPLDFHSPYGCSKGAGDQYVRDYARIFGIPTVVMRQSCIYGTRQFGVEDQGWVAWFIIAAITGRPITIYGDGKQVRDVLFIDDLLDAYNLAVDNIDMAAGEVFNVGGGPRNTMSIWGEFHTYLEQLIGRDIPVTWSDWRPGDQKIYVSDIRKAQKMIQWEPKVGVEEGITRLFNWVRENKSLFENNKP
jgi:CDP-paratose 2-epimerase